MSAIKHNIVLNHTVEENYSLEENCKTERKGCDTYHNASNTLSKQGGRNSLLDEAKKYDALWMTRLRDTFCGVRYDIGIQENCSERWRCFGKQFSKVSKAEAVMSNKENSDISLQNITGEQRICSAQRTNQTKCQLQIEKNSLRPTSGNNRKKVKGHVISKQSSLAISPFFSSHNLILTHYILFALLFNLILAIDSRLLRPTAIRNDYKSTERFSNIFDNEISAYGLSTLSQLLKYVHQNEENKLTVNHKSFKNLPYSKYNNSNKVLPLCHKCTKATKRPNNPHEIHLTIQNNTKSLPQQNLKSQKILNSPRKTQEIRMKRDTTVYEEISSDEENDAKLWRDMVVSMRQWQQRKLQKEQNLQKGHHRVRRDEEIVCYADVGCFRDDGPFNYLDMLPSPPEEVNTQILLYTRRNRKVPDIISYSNISGTLPLTKFNISAPLKVIIHGFGSSCQRVWPSEMRLALLTVENVNVMCVDWSAGAADPNYVRAAVNTRLVGKQLAILIEAINRHYKTNINGKTHFIGFSLGAHVAGFAGDHLKNLSRITGLDPAGPLFEGYEPSVRLDKSDAAYVDVIHSNGESLIVGGFGTWEPIGHVDFYPNGGRAQRGCQHLLIGGLYDFIYSYSSANETSRYLCNHRRAYRFFTDSISPKCVSTAFPCESYEKFERGECFTCSNSLVGPAKGGNGGPPLLSKSCGRMGYYSDKSAGRGRQYLLTRDGEPFCGKQFKIILTFSGSSSHNIRQTYGRIQITFIDKNGLNETFLLTSDVDDLLTSGTQLEKMIVTHPAIDPVSVHLLYVAYEGWIYTGRARWKIDKLLIINENGGRQSACRAPPLKGVISSTPATIPSKIKISTTAAPTKLSSEVESSPSSASNLKDIESKITTIASKTSSSPLPGSILPSSVTSLSAPPPPASGDKISAKSSNSPKPTPKIEVEGKLLPVLRSGIPQSIQLISTDCDIPSLADYYSHFPGNKFNKKPHPYLHNNLYNIGNGLYPNVNGHGIKKFNNALYHNQGFGGKDSIKPFNIHQPPPPPPPPAPMNDVKETTAQSLESELVKDAEKETNISAGPIKSNDSAIPEKAISTLEINDELAPISIPPIADDDKEYQKPIVVSTKLRPPPLSPNLSTSNIVGNIEVSDSVAPESIPALGPIQEQKKVLHHPSITTTYYNVVSDNKDHSVRPSYVSRPRPKIHFDDSDPSKIHQWNHLGKLPIQHFNQNGYLKYQLNGVQEGSKWPVKSTYFASPPSLIPSSAKRPIPQWPSVPHNNRHIPYQSYNQFSQGSPSQPSFQTYNPYSKNNLNVSPQLPYQMTRLHSEFPHPQSHQQYSFGDSTTEREESKIEFLSENDITNETIKHTLTSNSNTEATLMGKDSSMQRVTMHHLSSDEQLTILKVNPNGKISNKDSNGDFERISNNNFTLKASNPNANSYSENEITSNHLNESMGVMYFPKKEENDTHSMIEQNLSNQTSKEVEAKKDGKVDYIVLHKLPNGEALDLENMKTYTMVDLKNEIKDKKNSEQENISKDDEMRIKNESELIRPLTYLAPPPRRSDMPRSIDFSIDDKTQSKTKDIRDSLINLDSMKRNKITNENGHQKEEKPKLDMSKSKSQENVEDTFTDQIIKSYMSETPEDIDKLKAMMLESESSGNQDEVENEKDRQDIPSPVYIITEEDYMKHKSLLNEKERTKVASHSEIALTNDKHNEDEITVPKIKENVELLPTPKKQISLTIISPYNSSATGTQEMIENIPSKTTHNDSTTSNSDIKRADSNLEFHWTPMPEGETTPTSGPRVFGPQLPPEGYVSPEGIDNLSTASEPPIDIGEIDELSKIAYVTLNDKKDDFVTKLRNPKEEKVDFKLDQNDTKEINESVIEEETEDNIDTEINVQLLPPRLSAVLTHLTPHLPQRQAISSKTPQPLNRGQAASKERSIGQYNLYSYNSAPPYGYHNHGLFRQNKIAPIFKEEERQNYQSKHHSPPSSSSRDSSYASFSDNPINSQATFPVKQQFHALPKSSRAIPLSSSVEPRNYSPPTHGRQNNARRINYPKPVNNNQFHQPSPYQTQIVPGARDPLRYIPLHDATPPSKKYVPPHPPILRWRTRHRGVFHGRNPQQKHRRTLKQFNAKMLQASPTYASVEILRSHRRQVKPQVPTTHEDLKEPYSNIKKMEEATIIKEAPYEEKILEPSIERKLQINENNITNLSKDITTDINSAESYTEMTMIEEIDNSTLLDDDVTSTLSTASEIE